MEILAAENIEIGTDLFPPLSPLASSLYDSFLSSHCSSCFSLLPPSPPQPFYCSAACSLTNSPIILPQFPPDISPILLSDIRTALNLLNSTAVVTSSSPHRLNGLLTNHHLLMADSSFSVPIQNAANFIATVLNSNRKNTELEEAAICSVLTNAVEVHDSNGLVLGIALYDSTFSWINHSCSPNSCYRFVNNTTSYQNDLTIPHITNTETSSNLELKEQVSIRFMLKLCDFDLIIALTLLVESENILSLLLLRSSSTAIICRQHTLACNSSAFTCLESVIICKI